MKLCFVGRISCWCGPFNQCMATADEAADKRRSSPNFWCFFGHNRRAPTGSKRPSDSTQAFHVERVLDPFRAFNGGGMENMPTREPGVCALHRSGGGLHNSAGQVRKSAELCAQKTHAQLRRGADKCSGDQVWRLVPWPSHPSSAGRAGRGGAPPPPVDLLDARGLRRASRRPAEGRGVR
eukprot:gene19792-biopygen5525